MSPRLTVLAAALAFPLAASGQPTPQPRAEFTADAPSLARYVPPTWFRSAHFGIMVHWGVASVPAMGGNYSREMYIPPEETSPNPVYTYHSEHYGHPSIFGYKDLIPYWEAPAWKPEVLTKLFKKAGARYVVVVATGRDNVDNFDSKYQRWNSVNLGPTRDIVGDWKKAVRENGLRFGVMSYGASAWHYYRPSHGADWQGPKQDVPYDGNLTARDGTDQWWKGYDPQALYGPKRSGNPFAALPTKINPGLPPPTAFQENWFNRLEQLLASYQPDLLWLEGPLPFGDLGTRLVTNYYNNGRSGPSLRTDSVVCLELPQPYNAAQANGVVPHLARASVTSIRPKSWQTDISLTQDDYYTPQPLATNATMVIQTLCDAVSKNGNLLLNVALKADGSLPADQAAVLAEIGEWMDQNGEAVYQVTPAARFGVGPTRLQEGDGKQRATPFLPGDVRFSTQGAFVYAMFLGWPRQASFELGDLPKVHGVEWLGGSKAEWTATPQGISVALPAKAPNPHVSVLRIRVRPEDSLEY